MKKADNLTDEQKNAVIGAYNALEYASASSPSEATLARNQCERAMEDLMEVFDWLEDDLNK